MSLRNGQTRFATKNNNTSIQGVVQTKEAIEVLFSELNKEQREEILFTFRTLHGEITQQEREKLEPSFAAM